MGVTALVCSVVAIAMFYIFWPNQDRGIPDTEESRVTYMCKECGYTVDFTAHELSEHRRLKGKRERKTVGDHFVTSARTEILLCPECGKTSLVRAQKCVECGKAFLASRKTVGPHCEPCTKRLGLEAPDSPVNRGRRRP